MIHWFFILLCMVIVAIFLVLKKVNSPYLGWDYSQPETTVMGVLLHAFEWSFIRIAPLALVGAVAGVFWTRKKA